MEITNQNKIKSIIAFMFPAIVIFGNYSLGEVRIFGLMLTIGRVLIPLIFLYLLTDDLKQHKEKILPAPRSREGILLIVLAIWVVYAAITIVLMPYADFHNGILEMIALVLGAMIVINMVILCREGNWDSIMTGLKVAIFITLFIGVYEIITGNHLSTSRFCDPEFIRVNKELFGDEADTFRWYVATSIFFNENDYSAMIAVFAPLLYCGQRYAFKLAKGVDLILLDLCFAVLYFNNAFICFVAYLVGLAIVVLFGTENNKEKVIVVFSLVITRILVYFFENLIGLKLGMGDTLLAQIDSKMNGMGSMAYRLNTYSVTLSETFSTSKGMGFGAGSFTKYFSQFAESRMIMSNPHCFWFEILAEYGILILGLFAGVLIFLMAGLIIKYMQSKKVQFIAVIASGASLIIACVAPSTYLKSAYYWLPIAMAVYLADIYEPDLTESNEPFGFAETSVIDQKPKE